MTVVQSAQWTDSLNLLFLESENVTSGKKLPDFRRFDLQPIHNFIPNQVTRSTEVSNLHRWG
jgi:hypothetical protein